MSSWYSNNVKALFPDGLTEKSSIFYSCAAYFSFFPSPIHVATDQRHSGSPPGDRGDIARQPRAQKPGATAEEWLNLKSIA
jgi:hypothetical protein